MKKSKRQLSFSVFFAILATINILAGSSDVKVGALLVITMVCLAASDILEALGR